MVDIIRPVNLDDFGHKNELEIENQLIFVALQKHLGDKLSVQYVKELKDAEELTKQTIEGRTYYALKGKVILWIEFPERAINGSPYKTRRVKYQFY